MPDPSTTLARVVLEHPECAHLLRSHRLDYCCRGSLTLAEACVGKGLDPAGLLDEIERAIAARSARRPRDPRLLTSPELVARLREGHRRSARRATAIGELLLDVARPELVDVFRTLLALLKPHEEEEELVLFPEILSPKTSAARIERDIRALAREHFVLGDRLDYIRSLTDDFAVPRGSSDEHRALMRELSSFDDDLREHVHLENHVLAPRFSRHDKLARRLE